MRGAETRARVSVGAVVSGVVTAVKDFGAFVDLGGIEGMLPASELGFTRGVRPSEVLSVGQPLQVQILRHQEDRRSQAARADLPVAQVARARSLGGGAHPLPARHQGGRSGHQRRVVRGLRRAGPRRRGAGPRGRAERGKQVRHARELVKVGEQHEVTVLAIERERRRISLGIGDRPDAVDPEDLKRAASTGKLGTLGDLLKKSQEKKG